MAAEKLAALRLLEPTGQPGASRLSVTRIDRSRIKDHLTVKRAASLGAEQPLAKSAGRFSERLVTNM